VATATTTTTLKLSAKSVTYGHEQRERLFVTVSPQYPGATPTGRVAISGANCLITLSSGRGSAAVGHALQTGNRRNGCHLQRQLQLQALGFSERDSHHN